MPIGRRIERLYYEIAAETKAFDEGLLQSQGKLKAFLDFAKAHPAAVFGALAAAATATAAKLTAMAAEFQHEMQKVQTVVQGSTAQLGALGEGIKTIFRSLPIQDIRELTQGMYDITSSGIAAGDAIGFLDTASKAAVGGVTQVNVAVDGLTSAFNAFRAQGLTVEQISDEMFAAVAAGKTTFAELAQYMGQTSAVAAAASVSLADVLAATAQLTLGGVKTADAMVGVKSAIVNILRPTDEFKQKYAALAKEFDAAKLAQLGFVGFLLELEKAAKGNSDVFRTLFSDVQGFAAVSGLMKDRGLAVAAMLDKVKASAGATDQAARTMSEGADALHQTLKNQLNVQLQELGDKFLPAANAGLRVMLDLMDPTAAAAKALASTMGELAASRGFDRTFSRRATAADRRFGDALSRAMSAFGDQGASIFDGQSNAALHQMLANLQALAATNPEQVTERFKAFGNALEQAARASDDAAAKEKAHQDELAKAAAAEAKRAAEAAARAEAERKAAEKRKQQQEEEKHRLAAMKTDAEALHQQVAQAVVAATATAVDDLTLSIDEFLTKAKPLLEKGLISQADVDRFVAIKREAIALARQVEGTQAILDATNQPGRAAGVGDLANLNVREAYLRWQLSGEKNAERRKAIEEQLRKIEQRRLEIQREMAHQTADATEKAQAALDAAQAMARTIESAARGALQLASAFGLVDDKTAAVLENIVQVATSIDPLLKALKTGSMGDIVGAALPLVGGIASLVSGFFHGDPESQRIQRENTAAIEKLTRTLGEFGLAITGSDFAKAAAAAAAAEPLAANLGAVGYTRNYERQVRAKLESTGLSLQEFTEIAKTLGITFKNAVPTAQELQQVLDAIAQTQLTQFAQTFDGQLQALQARFDLFDITDPIAQLKELQDIFDDPHFGSPALAQALAGLDLSTPEGRQAAQQAIQQLFEALQSGTLTPEQLGGLTPQQFLDQLLNVKHLLESGGGAGTGGYNVDRSITEATGSHLAGLLTTANVYAQRTMVAVEAMAATFRGTSVGALPSLTPPAAPAAATGSATFGVGGALGGASITLQVVLTRDVLSALGAGALGLDAAQAIGQAAGTAAVERLDQMLGSALRRRLRLLAGSPVVS